ncbi:MAG: DUF5660 family protein [Candidatus Gottesmanbacteria bacterium]
MAILKKKQPIRSHDSVVEQLRGLGNSIVNSATNDLIGGVSTNVLNELFSPKNTNRSTDEKLSINKDIRSENDGYILPVSEVKKPEVILFTAQEQNLAREVEAVRQELKKTVDELKELNSAVIEVEKTVASTPVRPGTYHLSFFARLRVIIKLFRQQVSESRVWLEASTSKKQKRGYWSMFKKHGTTFGMSSERVIATQAG